MSLYQPVVLAVDDDPVNLEMIRDVLAGRVQEFILARNGSEALRLLHDRINDIDVILLDYMMPEMNGLEVLRVIRQEPSTRMIPVVMQTAVDSPEQIAECNNAGCFYYLLKPLNHDVLRAIVATAVRDRERVRTSWQAVENIQGAVINLQEAHFSFKTHNEVKKITGLLANKSSAPELLSMGLAELMFNAIEHGNLGITYDEKSRLIAEGRLEKEIECRLGLPKYADKSASLQFRKHGDAFEYIIKDQGKGFEWHKYLEIAPGRLMDNHGRGIAMARSLTFSDVEYQGCGNVVVAKRIEA